MRLFQKLKEKKIAKIEEAMKKVTEKDPTEDVEKWIKTYEFYLEEYNKYIYDTLTLEKKINGQK